jgi:hypothetical protein
MNRVYLVISDPASLDVDKVVVLICRQYYLTQDPKPPSMSLKEAGNAREWALHHYGNIPNFRCYLIDAETRERVNP